MKDPKMAHTRPIEPGGTAIGRRSWRFWLRPTPQAPRAAVPSQLSAADAAAATAGHSAYLAEVRQLVDDQSAVLFRMVTAAAAQASTAAQHIDVTHGTRSLTASVGPHAAVFQIELITDRAAGMGRAKTFMMGQARCIVPTPDGTVEEWVLALRSMAAGGAGTRGTHTWMDARVRHPITEEVVACTLRAVFP